MKEIEEDNGNGKLSHVQRSEELILFKMFILPKTLHRFDANLYQNSNGIFHRNRTNDPKICMEPQQTLKN